MLQTGIGKARAAPVSQEAFERVLSSIWWKAGTPQRLGLAVSGGVDSMALASLCSRMGAGNRGGPAFTGLIVDHGVRPGSADEAAYIANLLQNMNLDTRVLKLDWQNAQNPARFPNFETKARRKRYRILGEACRALHINTLMFAHHADDQAETVLTRLISGYTGSGLQGIKEASNIPECHGLYGVSESGTPRLIHVRSSVQRPAITDEMALEAAKARHVMIEGGGIEVHRPLLAYSKANLMTTCRENGVEWVEDRTNQDVGLTNRNTVRSLLRDSRLPAALSTEGLQSYSQRSSARQESRDEIVADIYARCAIRLNICSGSAFVAFPQGIKQDILGQANGERSLDEARRIAAILVRRLVLLSTPETVVTLQGLDRAVELAFPFLRSESNCLPPVQIPVCKVMVRQANPRDIMEVSGSTSKAWSPAPVRRVGTMKGHGPKPGKQEIMRSDLGLRVERALPTSQQRGTMRITLLEPVNKRSPLLNDIWSEWKLFDGRWWIRVQYRPYNLAPGRAITVRFLSMSDIRGLRLQIRGAALDELDGKLRRHTPGDLRYTLPAICGHDVSKDGVGNSPTVDTLLALPSIAWSSHGWMAWQESGQQEEGWKWEIRYKKVDLGNGTEHGFLA